MSEKLNIAMFFGGNSSEHDVSKRSARNIYDAMDKEKYNVTVFLISKDGYMINAADSKRVFDGEDEDTVVAAAKSKMDLTNPLACLLYTSPSPRDGLLSRMPSSA